MHTFTFFQTAKIKFKTILEERNPPKTFIETFKFGKNLPLEWKSIAEKLFEII